MGVSFSTAVPRTVLPPYISKGLMGRVQPERLTQASTPQFPVSLSPQGTHLIYEEGAGGPFNHDLMVLRLDRQATGASSMAQPQALIKTANGEANGAISPDGQWLAYQSNESGSWGIYVRPFADQNGARTTVSTGGGTEPRWSHDGRELFYISPRNEMMHVRVGTGRTWSSGTPEMLFDARQFFLGSVVANPYFMYRRGERWPVSDAQGRSGIEAREHHRESRRRPQLVRRLEALSADELTIMRQSASGF